MTETDYGVFESAFKRLSAAFRLNVRPGELTELSRTFFKVLEPYAIEDVLHGGRTLLESSRHMPKPADWLAMVRNGGKAAASCPPDVRHMSVSEYEEHARAAALGFEDQPCLCFECQRAGVDDRPLRYVPTLTPDGEREEHAFNPQRGVVETVGHWAHGEELRRYHEAKATFAAVLGQSRTVTGLRVDRLVQLVEATTRDREPGEEG